MIDIRRTWWSPELPRRDLLLVVAAGVALAGCPGVHARTDAGLASDGGLLDVPPPDVPEPDAPTCWDIDGDGYGAPECGGDDCDDHDPTRRPGILWCNGPGSFALCGGGTIQGFVCGTFTPACDARTGMCVVDACGDGVLHGREDCDDGNEVNGDGCDSDCTRPLCTSDDDCPAEAPSCSDLQADGVTLRCRTREPGGEDGASCLVDADCASRWCDRGQGRCTRGCVTASQCGPGAAWCSVAWSSGTAPLPARCAYECIAGADCPSGSACRPVMQWFVEEMQGWTPTWCEVSTRAAGFDEPCVDDEDCASLICDNTSLKPFGSRRRCSRLCTADSDCGGELPNCARYFTTADFLRPRPAEWSTPWVHVCSGLRPSDF